MAETPKIIEYNPQKTISAAVNAARAAVNQANSHAGNAGQASGGPIVGGMPKGNSGK